MIITNILLSTLFICVTGRKLIVTTTAKTKLYEINLARQGFGPGEQDWGYVTVRPGAHTFWWLFYTTANVKNYSDRPLLIWLQGGPGVSSTGYGNFAEIGPLDLNLNPRNHTWVKDANLMFVDNPVGTGWSYVENFEALVKKNKQIADDFLVFAQEFYKKFPEFKKVPTYIFTESYGGKMSVEIALVLDDAIKAGKLESNFIGVGSVDGWISPLDSTMEYAPFLYNVGAVDQAGRNRIHAASLIFKKAVDEGRFFDAWKESNAILSIVEKEAHNIDPYNILEKIPSRKKHFNIFEPLSFTEDCTIIELLMNGPVKKALNLTGNFSAQRGYVYDYLREDMMRPVTDIVEQLLNKTNIKVAIISGQLDFIVDTPGTVVWVDKLKWSKSAQWRATPRNAVVVNNVNEGYLKQLDNLSLYWANRAGHMVPAENPALMDAILRNMTNNFSGKERRK